MKKRIIEVFKVIKSQEISKIAGICWTKEPSHIRKYYCQLSNLYQTNSESEDLNRFRPIDETVLLTVFHDTKGSGSKDLESKDAQQPSNVEPFDSKKLGWLTSSNTLQGNVKQSIPNGSKIHRQNNQSLSQQPYFMHSTPIQHSVTSNDFAFKKPRSDSMISSTSDSPTLNHDTSDMYYYYVPKHWSHFVYPLENMFEQEPLYNFDLLLHCLIETGL
ncbi:hypothetical protein BC833DRAFT_565596 [Globomyces pollinis-pini]|nr:hypothetical protein BC833DRAFT_565596 [Globomyces pollinis-pini]